MAQAIFGTNLIVNGNAEAGPGVGANNVFPPSIPGWTSKGANVITYASGYGIATTDTVPTGAGKNYFANGSTASSMSQTVDLSSGAGAIDAGIVSYDTSGYFGGYADFDDSATMVVSYLSGTGATLSTVSLGGLKAVDRNGSGLYLRRTVGPIPAGTRSATVVVNYTITATSQNNAAADNLALILNSSALAPTIFGSNVVVNGDAESSLQSLNDVTFSTDVPAWVRTPFFTANIYGDPSSDLDLTSPAPPDQGKLYFYGGSSNPLSSAYQDIVISQGAAQIDAKTVKFSFSGWVGGYSDQNDQATITLTFMDWTNKVLSTTTLGPVLAPERKEISGLAAKAASGTVPAGARYARVQMVMTRTDGSDNDGMVDSIALVLTNTGAVPAISANGVATAAAFGGSKTIAPGTWIEIYGQNLAGTAREWAGGDFAGSNAPTVLDGVKVTIGGQSAFVRYVSAGQVNVQVPSGVGTGAQAIVVSNVSGTSAPYSINVASTQPAVLAPGSFVIGGKQYAAALFANGSTFALPPGTLPGVDSKYARDGDTIILYGLGFGTVSPNNNAGVVTAGLNSLTMPATVSIGGVPATLTYQGLAPGYVGLYQLNILVPAAANSDFSPLAISVAGKPIGQTTYIGIQN
jgi:uncharacterized protein (TIGR03437 family)